jgi:hypothetical protein
MAFWTNRVSPLIPQQKNKFYVVMGSPAKQQHSFWVSKTNLPAITYPLDKTQYGTGFVHVANGQPTWNEIQMEIYDFRAAQTDASNQFTNGGGSEGQKWFKESVLGIRELFATRNPDENGNFSTKGLLDTLGGVNTYGSGLLGFGTIEIHKLSFNKIKKPDDKDNDGRLLEDVWTLYGPVIKELNWGDLDYNSDEINKIQITFSYQYAELEQKWVVPPKVTPSPKK